jgi:GAF domain-containing protein
MEQVRRTARRERLIHEIASKVRRAPDMKTVLETTAAELRRALNASGASVRLGERPGPDDHGGERTSQGLSIREEE